MKVPFILDGPNGVLRHLERLIETKGFALVCVAEGAGQVRSRQNSEENFVTFTASMCDSRIWMLRLWFLLIFLRTCHTSIFFSCLYNRLVLAL